MIHSAMRLKFQCPNCNKTFFETHNLRTHCKERHPNESLDLTKLKKNPVSNNVCDNMPTCDICKKSFPRIENLKLHFKAYHLEKREKKLECHLCSKHFTSMSNKKKHFRLKHHGPISKMLKRTEIQHPDRIIVSTNSHSDMIQNNTDNDKTNVKENRSEIGVGIPNIESSGKFHISHCSMFFFLFIRMRAKFRDQSQQINDTYKLQIEFC